MLYAGRLNYEAMNNVIEEFNGIVLEKYNFLRQGFQAMASIGEKKRFKVKSTWYKLAIQKKLYVPHFTILFDNASNLLLQEMKSLENKETKGVYFIVADDLRSAPTLKAEGQRRTVFTILRHVRRIREIRGPGKVLRYAIM